jgi:hypothetical protein
MSQLDRNQLQQGNNSYVYRISNASIADLLSNIIFEIRREYGHIDRIFM